MWSQWTKHCWCMIKHKFATRPDTTITFPSLRRDMRAGHMKLYRDRFIKKMERRLLEFVECIDSMHVVGPCIASSFLHGLYMRSWVSVDKVNRGGLFYIIDKGLHCNQKNWYVQLQTNLTCHSDESFHIQFGKSWMDEYKRKAQA